MSDRDRAWPGSRRAESAEPDEEALEDVRAAALEVEEDQEEARAEEAEADAAEVEDGTENETPVPESRRRDEHAVGELAIPPHVKVLAGSPNGSRRGVAFVVSRFNGEITSRLLASALEEAERIGVVDESITVMPVPGAFELPLAAMALAKTRRYSCVVALGCVVRGETPHFDYVASEAASGLQLAGLETGVPVSFGVLTLESPEQAEGRIDKGAEALRTALEMADVFARLRASASAATR